MSSCDSIPKTLSNLIMESRMVFAEQFAATDAKCFHLFFVFIDTCYSLLALIWIAVINIQPNVIRKRKELLTRDRKLLKRGLQL